MSPAAPPVNPTPEGLGTVHGIPRLWSRLEGATLLVSTLIAYAATGRSWWLVAIVVLLPDLFMVGYLGGTRLGALMYNIAHATPAPALLAGVGSWQQRPSLVAIALVWFAHIGLDRLMGYGLKYSDHFQHTHLGWVGHRSDPGQQRPTRSAVRNASAGPCPEPPVRREVSLDPGRGDGPHTAAKSFARARSRTAP